MQRMANRHVVVFVTLRDSFLRQTADSAPDRFVDVARAVIAQDFPQRARRGAGTAGAHGRALPGCAEHRADDRADQPLSGDQERGLI